MTGLDTAHLPRDASRRHAATLTPARTAALAGVLFAIGIALGSSGALDLLADLAGDFRRAYVRAQLVMLQAQGNVAADGNAEYAVLADADDALAQLVAGRDGWVLRTSSIPGWQVVAAPPADTGALDLLREQPFVKTALRNRGLWICH